MMGNETKIADSLLGQVINRAYRIDRLVGRGGMGNVYDAVQLCLNRHVALKIMSRDFSANREAFALFRREAEVTSALGHPHIVQVFDFGVTSAGAPYMVLELLEGEDLDRRVRRCGQLPFRQTLHVIKQVAAALAATHAKGVVHQDLKPANIFLQNVAGESSFVKVLDFGISKVRDASPQLAGSSVLMGTPHYMSPEQALGQDDHIDERTDQWALACMTWELLSGHAPFAGENVQTLLFQVVHGEPAPLPSMLTSFCPELERVLRRALSKHKEARFRNVIEFVQALEGTIGRRTPTAYKVVEPSVQPDARVRTALPTVLHRKATHAKATARTARHPSSALMESAGVAELSPEQPAPWLQWVALSSAQRPWELPTSPAACVRTSRGRGRARSQCPSALLKSRRHSFWN